MDEGLACYLRNSVSTEAGSSLLKICRQRDVVASGLLPPVGELWAAGLLPLAAHFFPSLFVLRKLTQVFWPGVVNRDGLLPCLGNFAGSISSLAARFFFLLLIRRFYQGLG